MTAVDQIFKEAVDLHSRGEFKQAGKLYKKILKSYPQHPEVLHLFGLTAYQSGKYKSAVESFERAIAINPGNPDFFNDCGEAWRALKEYEAATRCYEKALALDPDFAEAHNNLGLIFKQLGQTEKAIEEFKTAIKLNPAYFEAHYNTGLIFHNLGKYNDAIENYEKSIALKPDFAEAYNNTGTAYKVLGNPETAINYYKQALALRPHYYEAHNNLGDAYQDIHNLSDAISHYKSALKINPNSALTYSNLGSALTENGQLDKAIINYEKALELKPDHPYLHNNIGNAYQHLGKSEKAIFHFEHALKLKPDFSEVYMSLAKYGNNLLKHRDLASEINNLLNNHNLSEKDIMHLHFALGDIYDSSRFYDTAFSHYAKANELKHKTVSFDIKKHVEYIDRLIDIYSRQFFTEQTGYGIPSNLPVFIVGMPRSGTTLIEQIISSHDEIYGAGELNDMVLIESRISEIEGKNRSYPECIKLLKKSVINGFANEYLLHLQEISSEAKRIIDKLPGNYLRIGLIKLLFPNAYIIHCKRNPLDTCLSLFFNNFAGDMDYSYSLDELAAYYREYERLMDCWQKIFSTQIFEIQYEQLVLHMEQTSMQIIDYLGLEWDQNCLKFYNNERPVQTASNLQVRKPIYTSSIDRWKNYEKYLEPLQILHK